MLNTVKATVKDGKIELLEPKNLPEGSPILVTVLAEDHAFWLKASEASLAFIMGQRRR